MRFWSGDTIKELKENQVFVFGSNPSGIHGAGAAKAAVEFGAKYGVGRGLKGQTYALITKNLKAGYHEKATGITYATEGYKSLSADQISENVKELYQCAKQHPDKFFIMAYKNETWPNGSSKKSLNGYTSEEMFELFMNNGDVPDNIILHNSFKPLAKAYLENQQSIKNQGDSMTNIPSYATKEAEKIKEIGLALASGDLERIVKSGFLDEADYYEDGVKFDLKYAYQIQSSRTKTAYQLDRYNNEVEGEFSFAEPVNIDKSYIAFSTFNGEHLKGEIVISNANECFILTYDKENNILAKQEGKLSKDSELLEYADSLTIDEEITFSEVIPDRDHEEASFYFKSADINNFESKEDLKEFKLNMLRSMTADDESIVSTRRAVNNILAAAEKEDFSYILIEHEGFSKSIIIEIDGNIFYNDYAGDDSKQSKEFKFIENGEAFNFKGASDIADKHILRSVEMYLDGLHEMTTRFADLDEPQVEVEVEPIPETKKTRTLKPGR